MENSIKIKKIVKDEIDEFGKESILDLDNCSVDKDFDEIDMDSLVDKSILEDWKDVG